MGIVKDVSGTQTTGKLPGTYFYMAPEMFTTNNRGTQKTDIYALGLCFYEALTGLPAFPRLPKNDKDAIVEMIARSQGKKGYRVSYAHEAFRKCPDLVHIIQQAIHPDPRVRYASAKHLWEDVAVILEQHFAFPVPMFDDMQTSSAVGAQDADVTRYIDPREVQLGAGNSKLKRPRRVLVGICLIIVFLSASFGVAKWQYPQLKHLVNKCPDLIKSTLQHVLTVELFSSKTESMPEPPDQQAQLAYSQSMPEPSQDLVSPMQVPEPENLANDELRRQLINMKDDPMVMNYDEAKKEFGKLTQKYDSLRFSMEGRSDLYDLRREFWGKHIAKLLRSSVVSDESFLAVANGLFVKAMDSYTEMLDTSDGAEIYSALIGDIGLQIKIEKENSSVSKGKLVVLEAPRYFPFRQSDHFSEIPEGDSKEIQWLKTVLGNAPHCAARFLPLRAKLDMPSGKGDSTSQDLTMEFSLVPFRVMSVSTPVEGQPVPRINSPFYLAAAETTFENMQYFWNETAKRVDNSAESENILMDSGPYAGATLNEAIEFCNWLSRYDGLSELYTKTQAGGWKVDLRKPGYRLPFNTEWEYAARFGYDFLQMPGQRTWEEIKREPESAKLLVNYYFTNKFRSPDPAFRYPLGLYDLCGNVPEICMQTSSHSAEPSVLEVDFTMMPGGSHIKSLDVVAPWLRSEERQSMLFHDTIKEDEEKYGFRVVRTIPICEF